MGFPLKNEKSKGVNFVKKAFNVSINGFDYWDFGYWNTAVGRKTIKSTREEAVAMILAVEIYPGNAYDNIYQIPGTKGKVNMIQPNGNVDVILGVSADGLDANTIAM